MAASAMTKHRRPNREHVVERDGGTHEGGDDDWIWAPVMECLGSVEDRRVRGSDRGVRWLMVLS